MKTLNFITNMNAVLGILCCRKKRSSEIKNKDVGNDHKQAESKYGNTSSGDTGQGGYGLTDS